VLVLPPLLAFLFTNPPAERLASLVPAVILFVAVVLWTVAAARGALSRRARVATVVLTCLSVLVVLVSPRSHWLFLFLYPVVAAGFVGPVRQAAVAIIAVSAIAAVAGWSVLTDAANRIERPLEFALVGFGALAFARLVIVNGELATARAEIARLAAADERVRIARDLHDLLGHGLSLITLKAELAGRLLPTDAARAAVEVADIEVVSRRALEDVRATVGGYRRLALDSELLGAQAALEAAGIATKVDHQVGGLPEAVDEAFAWSVREAATNVIRHAHARTAILRTRRQDGEALLEVLDDGGPTTGRGTLLPDGGGGTGSGLAGLAERVGTIGGRIEAGPRPDGGFRLAVMIPIEAGPS
jgi:two-component system sensor histidine kinase DesK